MAEAPEENKKTAKQLYESCEQDRSPFLERARSCSKLTLPTLIPPEGHNGSARFYTPFQSLGARGVNNLAAKLMLTQFPPNASIFKLSIDDFALEELTQQEGMRAKVEKALNKIERAVGSEIETGGMRPSLHEGLKHLIVGGNTLFYAPDDGGLRVFPLSRYVVRRDPMGNVLDIVVKEDVAPSTLDPNIQELLTVGVDETTEKKIEKTVELYTHVSLKGKKWIVYQEIKGIIIPESRGTYPKDKSPWIPLRLIKVEGENYGRSYVEEYLGDLISLEGLTQSIVEGSAAMAKLLVFVNPNGTTTKKDVAEAENGDVIDGNSTDVTIMQAQKSNDFSVAMETVKSISERLAFAFMLNSAIQRNGDRVTAEEIRYMAQELETALGGLYSILAQELQLPLITRLMFRMQRQKRVPLLPKGAVNPVIVTGMEALGRGNDLNRLETFIKGMEPFGEQLMQYLNFGDYLIRRGTAIGIDMAGLIKTPEQLQAEQQAAQQQQQQAMMIEMLQKGIPPAINQMGGIMKQGMVNEQGQTSGTTPSQ